jgi:hypothetical protein
MKANPEFQKLFKHQEGVSQRVKDLPPNAIDESVRSNLHDIQMGEAVRIVEDMIHAEMQAVD